MPDALSLIAGGLLICTLASFVLFVRKGPQGVWLAGHKRRHHCPTPDLCDDANACAMMCHERNPHAE